MHAALRPLLFAVLLGGLIAAGAGTATANEPQSPCENGNPTDLCGDKIEVFDEPPGVNCPNGGVKIVVTRRAEDADPVLETTDPLNPPEPPEPTTETFFVCNGADGEPGEPGEPGIPGEPGAPGVVVPGGFVIGPGGLPISIVVDTEVNVDVRGGDRGGRRCRFARAPRMLLPARLQSFPTVRVRVDRNRAQQAIVRNDRFIRVRGMRGKRCGPHVVTARKRGVAPTVRLWTVLSRTQLNRRVLIP